MKKQLSLVICLSVIVLSSLSVKLVETQVLTSKVSQYALASPDGVRILSHVGSHKVLFSAKQIANNSLAGGMPKGNEKGKRRNGRWRWNLWGKVC